MNLTNLSLLMDHIPVGILSLEQGGRFSCVNQTGLQILGVEDRKPLKGRQLLDFIHPDDHEKIRKALENLQKADVYELNDARLIRVDQERVDVHLKFLKLSSACTELHYLIIQDVTKLKQSQKLLQESDKLLALGELAAGIAHEIRNPLTSLKGFMQLIAASSEVNRTYSEIMLVEIERINSIVNELLTLVKPQETPSEPVYLICLLETVITLLSPQALLHNVQIVTHYNKPVNQLVFHGQANKIKQVFINLIKNAIESMPQGGRIIILVDSKDDQVQVDVIDQGCGIPEDQLAKIGKAFYTSKENGTGLGLMVTKNIIDQHGGTIKFTSEVGKGTIVEVNFPKGSGFFRSKQQS